MYQESKPKPFPKRVIDLDHPRPRRPQTGMSVTQAQRWVSTVLTVTIPGHFSAGLVVAAVMIDHSKLAPRIGLNALATFTAVMMIIAVRVIHGKRRLSSWPALGLYLTFHLRG
jgi:peptidoglycan/LPS O-acetylase OafA/YrhL